MGQTERFPFPLPFGWFMACRVDDVPEGPPLALRYFDTDLVAWNDGASVRLFDAYCPHLGAHLGVGGRVVEGCLVCPFHEWSFDGDGRNVAIPYAERPNGKARVRSYPTTVRSGFVLFWRHPDPEVEPAWEIPELVPEDFIAAATFEWRVRTAWQEVAENSVDMAHFTSVHGLTRVGAIDDLVIDGPRRHITSSQSFNTARGTFEGAIAANSYGPGIGVTHFDLMGRATLVSCTTPVDADEVHVRFHFFHSPDEVAAKITPPFAQEVQRQFEQDIPIWEAKRFVATPALAPSEKAVTEFRRWASQFYVTP
jgi:phenylpropionate dioxygenase-like ring-hydroxylating dioxygenase large terminal subunit